MAAHEVGHTLGLMHNMGASYSFPVDSLRSPSFTQKYGTTPSIMDYARNNYVAQRGDFERGVRMVPPLIGVYEHSRHQLGLPYLREDARCRGGTAAAQRPAGREARRSVYEFGAQQIF